MSRRILWVVPTIALLLCGCDESSNAEPARIQPAAVIAPSPGLEIESLIPLTPNLPTHLAIHSNGSLMWVQETAEGQDVAFVMGSQGVPLATPLTSQNILKGIGASKARGNIQSLAAGRGEFIYVYFAGHVGERAVCCVGQYSLTTSRFLILAETEDLLRISGLGQSLEKSRGRVIAGRKGVWLWLSGEDATIGIRMNFGNRSPDGKEVLERAFSSIDSKQGLIPLTGGNFEVWGGREESLYIVDRKTRLLHHVSPEGKETEVHPIEYAFHSQPIFDPQFGTIFVSSPSSVIGTTQPAAHPLFVSFSDMKSQTISFEHVQHPPGLDLAALRLNEIVPERAGHFIGFDEASGHVVRIKVKQ